MTYHSSHTFTPEELSLIGPSARAGTMPVLQITNPADSLLLRQKSTELSAEDVDSEPFRILKERMLATVQDPDHPGVGIAAPQVGVSRSLIAVQRMDREGEPFEFYINPVIERYGEQTAIGLEGCLSIPDRSEAVCRSQSLVISYLDESSLQRVRQTVEGFTAVIFQHEIDHLNGILYIDRMIELPDEERENTDTP
ncbi:MAG: peptide deformylase [Rikenellaceae bacterium]|nr:peptide deformylase [Rikenellaceae bacterium]